MPHEELKTFPPVVPAFCDWPVVPKVWLLAFGCFYLIALWFWFYPESFVSFLSDKSRLRRRNFLSRTWSGSSLVLCRLLCVTLNQHLKKWRSASDQCTLVNDNERDCYSTCCLKEKEWTKVHVYFPHYKKKREKKQAHRDSINEFDDKLKPWNMVWVFRAWEQNWVRQIQWDKWRQWSSEAWKSCFYTDSLESYCISKTHDWSDDAVVLYHGL